MGYSAKQRKIKVTLEGREKIVKRLKAMDGAASLVLMSAAKKGGQIAEEAAKRNCPVDTGALRSSIKTTENICKPTRADVKVDYDKTLTYGKSVELGARGREPKPFLRDAVDKNLDKINTTIASTIAQKVGGQM